MASLSYAATGSGSRAGGIGWINFDTLTIGPGQSYTNISAAYRDGSTITFDISNTDLSGTGGSFTATTVPTTSSSAFGSQGYTGLVGNVSLYNTIGGRSRIDLTNISVKDIYGNTIPNYTILLADAETTQSGEYIQPTTNGGVWSLLTTVGSNTNPTVTGIGTTSVTISGSSIGIYGAPVLATQKPTRINVTINGTQAFSIGLAITTLKLGKIIDRRLNPLDQFNFFISGTPSSTTITVGSTTGPQSQFAQVFATIGNAYIVNETMATGSISTLNKYAPIVSWYNATPGGTAVPSTNTIGQSMTLAMGDVVYATITNALASVSGRVLFNVANNSPTTGNPINNVPVVLRSTTTGKGMVVLTSTLGNFTINNVLADTYTLVEAWGTAGGVTTPANYDDATTIASPTPLDPPVSAVPSPPSTTNAVQSLSPNTKNLTVNGSNLTAQNFIDGPVANVVINKYGITTVGTRLITAASYGTWGSLPAGALQNTSPATEPYPGVVPGFTYVQPGSSQPSDGRYSVSNINTRNIYGCWYNMADHTSRDETGYYQIVNGANPGAIMFRQTVNVTPYTYYLVGIWITNLLNPALISGARPQLGVLVKDSTNTTIFNQVLSSINAAPIPTWNEVSTLLNVGNNTNITLQLYSNGPAATGNDYAIDDIYIDQASIPYFISSTKSVSHQYADIGDTITYTAVFANNPTSITAYKIVFSDTIPAGTTFRTGTVRINGTTVPSFNPTPPGFTITNPVSVAPNGKLTVNFSVTVSTIPTINPIVNSGLFTADFLPIPGGSSITQSVITNQVYTTISHGEISARKSSDYSYVTFGDTITYSIALNNYGTTLTNNIILKDTIPTGTVFVPDSVTINGVTISGAVPVPPSGINVGTISVGATSTVTFQVIVSTIASVTPISNSANVTYNYIANPTIPIIKTTSANTPTVNTTFNYASIASTKSASAYYTNVLNTITYYIALKNTGTTLASNILFIDTIPIGTMFVENSLKQDSTPISGSPNPPGITLPNLIGAGTISTISFDVTVLSTIPSPNPIQNISTINYIFTVDPSAPSNINLISSSNDVNIQVNNANFKNMLKSVDKAYGICGEILTYTITLPNDGNVTATNVIFRDTILSGMILVQDSVTLDGVTIPGANPEIGIYIGTVPSSSYSVVRFSTIVSC